MTRVVVLALVLASAPACRSKAAAPHDAAPAAALAPADAAAAPVSTAPETIVLDEVEVRLRGLAETALVGNSLGRELARCLIESNHAVALERQVPPGRVGRPARLRVEIAAPPPAAGDKVAVVMDAQLTWLRGDDPAPTATVTGDATPIGGKVDRAVVAVTARLQEAVCADLGARIELWSADDLRPALTAADPGAALWALQLVAHRGPAPDLLDAVVPWLDREPPLRAAAISALVALDDPRAVAPLTAIADLSDKVALTTIVEAATAIGGDDARDFLEVMASHRDPTIAEHARSGLQRLGRE